MIGIPARVIPRLVCLEMPVHPGVIPDLVAVGVGPPFRPANASAVRQSLAGLEPVPKGVICILYVRINHQPSESQVRVVQLYHVRIPCPKHVITATATHRAHYAPSSISCAVRGIERGRCSRRCVVIQRPISVPRCTVRARVGLAEAIPVSGEWRSPVHPMREVVKGASMGSAARLRVIVCLNGNWALA